MDKKENIAIIGSGLIGQSWAMLFIAYGYPVRLYDVSEDLINKALTSIKGQLSDLEKRGLLRGQGSADDQLTLLTGCPDLKECLQGARYVQECVSEDLQLKKKVFRDLDALADSAAIIASSSSAIPSSKFTEDLSHRHRCLNAHPVNPPYYMTLVELVSAPWTDPNVVQSTRALIESIGQSPVILKKEVPAFVQPRIQYAIIAECLNLVQEGVLSVDDVDKLIRDGLGNLFSFVGPFQSLHISNDNGFRGFLEEEGSGVQRVVDSLVAPQTMSADSPLVEGITAELCRRDPLGQSLVTRRQWRDTRLAQLSQVKSQFNNNND